MLSKKYLRAHPDKCQVTFRLPEELQDADEAYLVGEFNDWDQTAERLKRVRRKLQTTLLLDKDQEYQFRYFVNGNEWYNDDQADKYVPNDVGEENSVVIAAK